ncbi:MAG: XrtA/PEP-CTERM system-associated ATPase [Gammaproteobacteria bacterium]
MYRSFYHLSAKPFRLTPDPRFYFNARSHKRALAYLLYGVRQGEGFVVISGDVGTGKTTLMGTLAKNLERHNVLTAKIVTTQLDADDLLRVLCAELGLPFERDSKAVLLKTLEEFLRECLYQRKRVILIIDEAQNLPPRSVEELRMLSNFQLANRPMLQTFLLGQRELRQLMRSRGFEQLRQRVMAAYHLEPFSSDETRSYIEHRLRLASWKGDPTFADEVFDGVHRFTNGVPRRINVLCDRLLLFACLDEKHDIKSDTLDAVASEMRQDELGDLRDGETGRYTGRAENKPPTDGNDRFSELEQSVALLSKSLNEEMARLREAVVETRIRKH